MLFVKHDSILMPTDVVVDWGGVFVLFSFLNRDFLYKATDIKILVFFATAFLFNSFFLCPLLLVILRWLGSYLHCFFIKTKIRLFPLNNSKSFALPCHTSVDNSSLKFNNKF